MRGADLGVPLLVAVTVVAFVGYLWFQGRTHTVDFAVTGGSVRFVDPTDRAVPAGLRKGTTARRMLQVDVAWEAAEEIGGGAYHVLVAAPPGWHNHACLPECEWSTTPDLEAYADTALPVATHPRTAMFPAEQSGRAQVAFVPGRRAPDRDRDPGFEPAAWLVQTDGDNVLQAERIS